MINSKKYLVIVLLIGIVLMLVSQDLAAQCPMCKIAAQANLENGGSAGKGLNKGILYILLAPYILVTTLGILWYRSKKNSDYDDVAKWN